MNNDLAIESIVITYLDSWFHGIIPGWKILRFTTDCAAKRYGIKPDVVEFPYGECPTLKGDSRDVKAVTRLASALSKLLLLNPDDADYEEYVLNPAKELRQNVRSQLAELNPNEFSGVLNVGFWCDLIK